MQEAFTSTHMQLATLTAGTGTSESSQAAAMQGRKELLVVSLKVCVIVHCDNSVSIGAQRLSPMKAVSATFFGFAYDNWTFALMQTLETIAAEAEAFISELEEVAGVAMCMSQVLTATVAKEADQRCAAVCAHDHARVCSQVIS